MNACISVPGSPGLGKGVSFDTDHRCHKAH